jgi:hypothetical protein
MIRAYLHSNQELANFKESQIVSKDLVIVHVLVLIQQSSGSSVDLGRPRSLGERPAGLARTVGSVTQIKVVRD